MKLGKEGVEYGVLNNNVLKEQFGVNPLTGEACKFSQRILCDLTEEGKKLVQSFLGVNGVLEFEKNWNSGSAFSMMMDRRTLYKDLAIYAALQDGAVSVIEMPGSMVAVFSEEYSRSYKDLFEKNKDFQFHEKVSFEASLQSIELTQEESDLFCEFVGAQRALEPLSTVRLSRNMQNTFEIFKAFMDNQFAVLIDEKDNFIRAVSSQIEMEEQHDGLNVIRNFAYRESNPTANQLPSSRNVHAMSGRAM